MDRKRPLLTQVPSQMDVGDMTLLTQLPSQTDVGDTTTLYIYSRPIGPRFEFDEYEEATFDPSPVSNRCWDQKLARVGAWCGGSARDGPQPRRFGSESLWRVFTVPVGPTSVVSNW
eukprot:scaffold174248_cov28-Attheya_sp.AAC.3